MPFGVPMIADFFANGIFVQEIPINKDWPIQESLESGKHGKQVQHPLLVESSKILLPPLHIKLGLMKNFVKAFDKTQSAFKYLCEKFPRLSEAKTKEGILLVVKFVNFLEMMHLTRYLLVRKRQHGKPSSH